METTVLEEAPQYYCFVAMAYASRYESVFDEIIKPAVENSGLRVLRGDMLMADDASLRAGLAGAIQAAHLVVADITDSNPNVMYELGISHSYNRPTVLISQDDDLPVDLQGQRVYNYSMSDSGKAAAMVNLETACRRALFPREQLLHQMIGSAETPVLVVYGTPTRSHIDEVYPPVSVAYERRLQTISAEVLGVSLLTNGFWRLMRGVENQGNVLVPVDAALAPDDMLAGRSAFLIGGPAVNRFVEAHFDDLKRRYSGVPIIELVETAGGMSRWCITVDGQEFPSDQLEVVEGGDDYGLLTRSPDVDGSMTWSASGLRAYGTEAAIRAMVTPGLTAEIAKLAQVHDPSVPIWAILKVESAGDTLDSPALTVFAAGDLR